MAAVTTERLMQIALEMAGMSEVPPDSRVEYAGTRISHILFGIDVGPAELFMARQLGYHAVIAQRPNAIPAEAWRLMMWHVTKLHELGVGDEVASARNYMEPDIRRSRYAALSSNQDVMPSTARLLELPLVTIASPLDEIARTRLQRMADELTTSNPEATVGDLRETLLALDEFSAAPTNPWLAIGRDDNPLGNTLVIPGSISPPRLPLLLAYMKWYKTLLCPVVDPQVVPIDFFSPSGLDIQRANLLVTGRIATASLGANPYVVRLRSEGLEVHAFAGVLPPEG